MQNRNARLPDNFQKKKFVLRTTNFMVLQDIFRVSCHGGASPTSLPLLILTEVLPSVTTLILQLKIIIYYADYAVLQAHS